MVRLLIIADDFTGALDTGVKFASGGAEVRVVTDYDYDFHHTDRAVQVLVMDAETRHISGEEAYRRVYQIAGRAKRAGISCIYKKTDSALRGNIGSELSAVLAAVKSQVLHFFPAFPEMGRTTKNGVHYIDGIPVSQSVFGQDPFEPVTESDISRLLARQSEISVRIVTDGKIATGEAEPLIAVYDAETTEELETFAKELIGRGLTGKEETETPIVLAGCAGMAETLPELLGLTGQAPDFPLLVPQFLVACGSVNPITKSQLDFAEKNGFHRIRLTPQQKLEPGFFETETGRAQLLRLARECRDAVCCILDTNDEPGSLGAMSYAAKRGLTVEDVRVRISAALGRLVKLLLDQGVESTLMITGGDCLLGFMNQIHVYEMTPICEMAPGTVLSRFKIDGRSCEVISKSGGFGTENLMVELAGRIVGEKEEKEIC